MRACISNLYSSRARKLLPIRKEVQLLTEKEKFAKSFLIRVREDMDEEVRRYCEMSGRNISDFIREAISEKLERERNPT